MTARRNHRDLTELTSREREVLDLLGLELTNEQIAERLGISLDGAKYHVSQILSKLGVSRREEAVRATSGRSGRLARLGVPLGARIIGGALLVLALGGAGVLAAMVALDGDAGPVVGDHWHAKYAIYIGDDRQEVLSSLDSSMTTPGDGIIHIEPRTPDEERENASLARFFEDAGGELTDTSLRLPGSDTTYRNGDDVPGIGAPGSVFILRESAGEDACPGGPELAGPHDFVTADYVPQDGERIRILFTTDEALRLEAEATCSPANLAPGRTQ
ncbi:MAG: helix-turn-helix transcriptional regulator [Chloroflexi bacterium]|nr:helix-turn-helix transcriptional regulator [Chloroflexota bacterium]